ncbi:MAG: pilus assembly protein [Sphingomonadales bacterium]|nr:pilus assembly protein [Sphingomonadales bacterium]
MTRSWLLRCTQAIRRCTSGTVMVEFAVLFPVLLTMYLGSFTLSDAISCNRKVTVATRALTDLTSRYSILADSDLTNIMNASIQVLAPYSADNADIVISEVKVTDEDKAKVVWSRTRSGTALTVNSTINIPDHLAANDTYLVVGTITYTYTPAVTFGIAGPITFTDTILMSPRLADQITIT